MYLISIYFDDTANRKIQHLIDEVADKTGNTFMSDHQVPPHITVSAFETRDEALALSITEAAVQKLKQGTLQWVSSGQFFPYVMYISPVLNSYLHELSDTLYQHLSQEPAIALNRFYQPFQWMPHTTIGKQLSEAQMMQAFEVLQKHFAPFTGSVVKIGLAKPNPHVDLASWTLK